MVWQVKDNITPATKYIKVVIPAKVLRQAQDHELAEWPESRRALDAPGLLIAGAGLSSPA